MAEAGGRQGTVKEVPVIGIASVRGTYQLKYLRAARGLSYAWYANIAGDGT